MKIKDYLNKSEIEYFTERSNGQAWQMLLWNWLSIFLILFAVYYWTNPLMIILAIIFLGGRQLGLAVIMHECGHNTFFTSPGMNRFVGQWLSAAPIFNDLTLFFNDHRQHHQKAGTDEDPNLVNYQAYPVSRKSFKRKVTRDLTARTGSGLISAVIVAALGVFSKEKRAAATPALKMLWGQLVLALALTITMSPWLYLVWLASIMTSFMLIVRIRQIAEHAAVPDLFDADARNNSRTTIPRWWERPLIAPNYVNYHLEHHFMASVPCYKLPELHRLMKSKGAYEDTHIYQGYGEVISRATGTNIAAVMPGADGLS